MRRMRRRESGSQPTRRGAECRARRRPGARTRSDRRRTAAHRHRRDRAETGSRSLRAHCRAPGSPPSPPLPTSRRARRPLPSRAGPGIAAMMLPPMLAMAIAAGVVVGAAKTGLLPEFLSSTSSQRAARRRRRARRAEGADRRPRSAPGGAARAVADAAALDALAARIASLRLGRRPTSAGDGSDAALTGKVEALEKSVGDAARRSRRRCAASPTSSPARSRTSRLRRPSRRPPTPQRPRSPTRPSARPPMPPPRWRRSMRRLDRARTVPPRRRPRPRRKPPTAAPRGATTLPLRRLVAATLLDLTVKQGAPYRADAEGRASRWPASRRR